MPDRPTVTAAQERKGEPRGSAPLCFIVDEDFGLRQEISKEMRRLAIDVVEFSNSARLLGMVDDQNPDIVVVNVVGSAPHEALRALLALKECRWRITLAVVRWRW